MYNNHHAMKPFIQIIRTVKKIICLLHIHTHTHTHKINRMKRRLTEWEKMFVNHTSDKGSIARIYKQLSKLNKKSN